MFPLTAAYRRTSLARNTDPSMGLSARQSVSLDSIVSSVMGDFSPTAFNETASLEFSPLQHISTERDPSGFGVRARASATGPHERSHLQGFVRAIQRSYPRDGH